MSPYYFERKRAAVGGEVRVMSTLVPSQVTPNEETATTLVAKLRESGRVSKAEWTQFRSVIEDLQRTLKQEPLTFEDAFALALVDEEWSASEAWAIAKRAAREISSVKMREALETEYRYACEMVDEHASERDYEDERGDWERKDRELRC